MLWLLSSPSVVCWAFFNQVQIGRIGRQIQQLYPQRCRRLSDRWRMMVGGVIKHDQQPLAAIGGSDLSQQLDDPLGITRRRPFQANQVTVVGRIGPKNVEAIAARIGLESNRVTTPDPALRRNGCME